MNVGSNFRLLFCAITLVTMPGFTARAGAQAETTARRSADLLVFGGFGYVSPDYGPQHNKGITFGADYDRYFGWRAIPGLEFRSNFNSGPTVKEHSYLTGPRVHVNLSRRYRPYGAFLVGVGMITYPVSTVVLKDHGLAYAGAGGIDVDVAHNVMFKADYQFQKWNLGKNASVKPGGGDFTLGPMVLTLGVTYRIPFRH